MTKEQYAKTKQIFLDACEKPAEERTAFVQKACEGDDEMLREVQSLLREHHSSANVMPDNPEAPLGPMSAILSHAGIELDPPTIIADAAQPDESQNPDEAHDQTSGSRSGIVD